MTNTDKPAREFYLIHVPNFVDGFRVSNTPVDGFDKDEDYHVISYDAYEALQKELTQERDKVRKLVEAVKLCHRRMKHTAWVEDECFEKISEVLKGVDEG